jgi:cytochrome c oxidase assembly protein subunit 11
MAQADTAGATPALRSANRTLLLRLCVVVVAMFGFGYLMVPFYEKFCEVTGIRNIGRADETANTQVNTSRNVRIELDGNLRNLPWQFRAQQPLVEVHPGALTHVTYEVVNTTNRPIMGQAIPSYAPQHPAQYFRKLDCFCFTTQTLQPGERREMPVVFVIDPNLPDDLTTITLSYTFFEVEGGTRVARSDGSPHTVSGESK